MASSIINLENGLPTVESALMRLRLELSTLRRTGVTTIKIIHGYGSSGTGGAIRTSTRQYLSEQLKEGKIRSYCAGEAFGPFESSGRNIVHIAPALRKDTDWGNHNEGVTLVVLR